MLLRSGTLNPQTLSLQRGFGSVAVPAVPTVFSAQVHGRNILQLALEAAQRNDTLVNKTSLAGINRPFWFLYHTPGSSVSACSSLLNRLLCQMS